MRRIDRFHRRFSVCLQTFQSFTFHFLVGFGFFYSRNTLRAFFFVSIGQRVLTILLLLFFSCLSNCPVL